MFSSCKELTGKSLVGHLLKDGSWLEEGVDGPQAGLQAWIRVSVGMLRLLLGFDPFGLSVWRCWAKGQNLWYPQCHPFSGRGV